MFRVVLYILMLFTTINARENPFFPSEGEKDIPYTSTDVQSYEMLQRASIEFPSEARVLQKVTIEYKNLDGSIVEKSIELGNAIDWHLPLFISQNYAQKSVVVEPKVQKKSPKIVWNTLATIEGTKFLAQNKSLKIVTKDAMLRHFLLPAPHRVVLDFKREASFRSYTQNNKNSVFKVIRVGNHSGYYRVVIELDGTYKYKIQKKSDAYLLELE